MGRPDQIAETADRVKRVAQVQHHRLTRNDRSTSVTPSRSVAHTATSTRAYDAPLASSTTVTGARTTRSLAVWSIATRPSSAT